MKLVTVALPSALVRQLARALHTEPAAASSPRAATEVERPRLGYSIKGKAIRAQLTPRAIQVLDFLRDHKGSTAHDVEKFLVTKAAVPKASAPNSFRGAMARLRAQGVIATEPLSQAAERAPRTRKKARKH